jgi:hypothetical protein
MLVVFSAYSLTLKMEAICFSETSVDFKWTTRHYIPEDQTLHNCCESLKSYNYILNESSPLHCEFPGTEIVCYNGNTRIETKIIEFKNKVASVYIIWFISNGLFGSLATESSRLYIRYGLYRWQHRP